METKTQQPLQERAIAEVMTTDLLTIGLQESVLMAWELMCQGGVHHLPVVDASGHCPRPGRGNRGCGPARARSSPGNAIALPH